MPRAALIALLLLQATPARYTPDAIRARATRPLVDQHRDVTVALGDRHLGTYTISYADGAVLVAPRGPLGHHGPRVRVAHGMIGVDRDRGTDVVFGDAVLALQEVVGPDLTLRTLAELVLGVAPDGRWSADAHQVEQGPLTVAVDREGRVQWAVVGDLALHHDARRSRLETPVGTFTLTWGARVERPIPPAAFALQGRLL
jgi:hypothetical protein